MSAIPAEKARTKRPRRRPASLSQEEHQLYRDLPEEADYVRHPSFASSATEERLFGPERRAIRVSGYRLLPEVPEDSTCSREQRGPLGAQDERELFLRYNYAKYRLSKLLVIQRRRFSSHRARHMVTWHGRAMEIRAKLVQANMALVPAMAKRMAISSVEFGELVSEGYMAVLRSIEKFDVSRGFKFSTYACRAIQKAFQRLARKVRRYQRFFPVEFDSRLERSDHCERRRESQREDCVDAVQQVLRRNRAELSQVELAVVLERFPLQARKRGTLAEVGRMVGLSKERVRQVQEVALGKLREALEDQLAV